MCARTRLAASSRVGAEKLNAERQFQKPHLQGTLERDEYLEEFELSVYFDYE